MGGAEPQFWEAGSGPDAAGDGPDDVLELGGGRAGPSRWPTAVVLATAALLAGGGLGFLIGSRQPDSTAASTPRVSSPATVLPAAGAPALVQTGNQCSTQTGGGLQLGVEVVNRSSSPVRLRRVRAVLPLGGLRELSQAWGPCGRLQSANDPSDYVIAPGADTWFTVTFRVLVGCSAPLPVRFTVDYAQHGEPATTELPGFGDLGGVPYGGCLSGS